MQLLHVLYIPEKTTACVTSDYANNPHSQISEITEHSVFCRLSLRVSDAMHNEKGLVHFGNPPPPLAWGCLSFSLSLSECLVSSMNYEP